MSIRVSYHWLVIVFALGGLLLSVHSAEAQSKPRRPVEQATASEDDEAESALADDEESEEVVEEENSEAMDEPENSGEAGDETESAETEEGETDEAESPSDGEDAASNRYRSADLGGTAPELLERASRLSKKAKTELELQQILRLCEQARAKSPTRNEVLFAKSLASWAHNRRGELLADHAQSVPNATEAQRTAIEKKALKEFETAISLDPKRWKAYHNRGVSHGAIGNVEQAVTDFAKVIELNPEFHLAYFNRAELRRQSGNFEEAIVDYTHAARLAPDDPMPFVGRAMAQSHLGNDESAFDDYTQAVDLSPTNVSYRLERAEFAQVLSKWDVASSEFAKTIELQEDCAAAYRGYGWLLATCPQPKYRSAKAAIEATERAMALAKDANELDYRYYDALAAAYANAGRFEAATQAIDVALAGAPKEVAQELAYRQAVYARKQPFRQGVASKSPATTQPPTPSTIQPTSGVDTNQRIKERPGMIPREELDNTSKAPANLKGPRRAMAPGQSDLWQGYRR